MHVAVISGTNRPSNLSYKVACSALEILAEWNHPHQLLDLQHLPADFASSYLQPTLSFQTFQAQIDQSSHLLFVVPEYNGSMPGILKLFIDACRYPDTFKGKSASLIGLAAGSYGNESGIRHLREILTFFGANVQSESINLSKIRQKFTTDGKFIDPQAQAEIRNQLEKWLAIEGLATTKS